MAEGGRFPIWSRNGRELFFWGPDKLFGHVLHNGWQFIFSRKSCGWSGSQLRDWAVNRISDLAPDGKRFAVILDTDQSADSKPAMSVTVFVNFYDALRRAPSSSPAVIRARTALFHPLNFEWANAADLHDIVLAWCCVSRVLDGLNARGFVAGRDREGLLRNLAGAAHQRSGVC
jgi:hypothetical protein